MGIAGVAETATIRSRCRTVRTLAALSIAAILLPFYAFVSLDPLADRVELLIPVYLAPLWAPWAWVSFRLAGEVDSFTYKRALAIEIGWSTTALVFASIILFSLITSGGGVWKELSLTGPFALLQAALVFASVRVYYSMPKEDHDRRILVSRLSIAGCVLLTLVLLPRFLLRVNRAPPEASAVASLRTINTAQLVYAQQHPDKGFASSLIELGPSSGADLIDATLANGKKSGYVITMYAGSADPQGRMTRYTVIARPEHFGKDGMRSFLTDESGIFHMTSEERVPTRQDPLL
jgi:hypothetical protein